MPMIDKAVILWLATFVLLLGCSNSDTEPKALSIYWADWSALYIEQWHTDSQTFHAVAEGYCSDTSSANELHEAWSTLWFTWASLNQLPYPAIGEKNLEYDLYFWPDRRNMIQQRLGQRMASHTPLLLTDMHKTVAAEKGLPALEWLLTEPDLIKTQQCLALPAIAAFYAQQVAIVYNEYQTNSLIPNTWLESPEGTSIALNLTFQQVNNLADRLRNGLDSNGHPIANLTEGWRSKTTLKLYTHSLASVIHHLVEVSHQPTLSSVTRASLLVSIDELQGLSSRLSTKAPTDMRAHQMQALKAALANLGTFIEGPIAQDLEVLIGFNNYDGD